MSATLARPLAIRSTRAPGLHHEVAAEPCVVVIFGATGDLTHRKLLPALYNLAADGHLASATAVVGFARRPMSDEAFSADVDATVREFSRRAPERDVLSGLASNARFVSASFDDPAGYQELGGVCAELDRRVGTRGNRLYYLATSPTAYATIVQQLGSAGLVETPDSGPGGWTRIIVEKPFGRDLESARDLNQQVGGVFREDQIYRIDHYLGKETVQNILAFRFSNGIFESIWNRQHIDHVQITVAESLGVEGRGPYYEVSGALRDMVANHMLQVLALVAMEPPIALDATSVRDEKLKVLRSIHPLTAEQVAAGTVRGQYTAGPVGPAYRAEDRVAADSVTETFVALRLMIDNWRWAGVPFYLRHGKRLPKRSTDVLIRFKPAPEMLFSGTGMAPPEPNTLRLRIQPNDGISLRFGAKTPGPGMSVQPVDMNIDFGAAFGAQSADAYERLILDSMQGNPSLFTRGDETEAAWALITSILEGWAAQRASSLPAYEAGTWGPPEAHELIERDGRHWIEP
ncbi:MAG: glucose-6-phosphate dehydrogenase [Chloroflexota bacterium]